MIQGKENLYIFAPVLDPRGVLAHPKRRPEATGRKRNVIA